MTNWYENSGNIAALIRWLRERGEIDFDNAIYLVEKPWKWTDEYHRMCDEAEVA